MTKAKSATKQKAERHPNQLPPRPPQDLNEAVLFGAASEITPEVEADYVEAIYRSGNKMSEKQKQRRMRAILLMATVGFTFINWQKNRQLV